MEASLQHTQYRVQTPVFKGPLDLLLQLIERAELDITVLALAQVTDQYLVHIRAMDVPAEDISSFLVIAAKLLQIKSETLLPRPPVREAGEEDPGEALARQLLIYKRFKEIATWLECRVEQDLRSHLHLPSQVKIHEKLDLSGITLSNLLAVAEEILKKEEEKSSLATVIAMPKVTIRDKIKLIATRLGEDHNATFVSLLAKGASRLEIVVTFLALLELVKRYQVSASQEKLFSDIHIEQLGTWGVEEDIEIEFE